MTLLVTSIAPKTKGELAERASRAWDGGADAVEIRIDEFDAGLEDLNAFLRDQNDRTWIVTCRSAREGGQKSAAADERASRLAAAVRNTGAFVDFELHDWQSGELSDEARKKLLDALSAFPSGRKRLILSAHDPAGRMTDRQERARSILSMPEACAAKLVDHPHHVADTFSTFDLLYAAQTERRQQELIALAMGEDGLWTRILAGKLGAFATYCALAEDSATASGQLTLEAMLGPYRWRTINETTHVYGVIGDPVKHSMSPPLFNRWFAEAGINAVYLPLRVRGGAHAVGGFLEACRARPWLDVRGLSVTIPHKPAVLAWLNDAADWTAHQVGAVNTLHFTSAAVRGYNTDCHAAIASLAAALNVSLSGLAGLNVEILGAGGAARAVAYGLTMHGCRVDIFARSLDKARRLADQVGATAGEWENRTKHAADVLVNCTSVGMWPAVDESVMPPESLRRYRLVFDLIYNPPETKLLRDAAAADVQTLNGLDMFIRQAAAQFELWTGRGPETNTATEWLHRKLEIQRLKPA